jgi:hypothetical protein
VIQKITHRGKLGLKLEQKATVVVGFASKTTIKKKHICLVFMYYVFSQVQFLLFYSSTVTYTTSMSYSKYSCITCTVCCIVRWYSKLVYSIQFLSIHSKERNKQNTHNLFSPQHTHTKERKKEKLLYHVRYLYASIIINAVKI